MFIENQKFKLFVGHPSITPPKKVEKQNDFREHHRSKTHTHTKIWGGPKLPGFFRSRSQPLHSYHITRKTRTARPVGKSGKTEKKVSYCGEGEVETKRRLKEHEQWSSTGRGCAGAFSRRNICKTVCFTCAPAFVSNTMNTLALLEVAWWWWWWCLAVCSQTRAVSWWWWRKVCGWKGGVLFSCYWVVINIRADYSPSPPQNFARSHKYTWKTVWKTINMHDMERKMDNRSLKGTFGELWGKNISQ